MAAQPVPARPLPPSPLLVRASAAAWERYKSTCRLGGTDLERAWAFGLAMRCQAQLWRAEGAEAGRV